MKKLMPIIAAVIVAGALGFFGGMSYGKSSASVASGTRQRFLSQANGGFGGRGNFQNGGFVSGEILNKDSQGITVKTREGSSKIVLVSNSTQIMKSVQGSVSDLSAGEQVVVMGTANSDGSLTA